MQCEISIFQKLKSNRCEKIDRFEKNYSGVERWVNFLATGCIFLLCSNFDASTVYAFRGDSNYENAFCRAAFHSIKCTNLNFHVCKCVNALCGKIRTYSYLFVSFYIQQYANQHWDVDRAGRKSKSDLRLRRKIPLTVTFVKISPAFRLENRF